MACFGSVQPGGLCPRLPCLSTALFCFFMFDAWTRSKNGSRSTPIASAVPYTT